MLGSVRQAKEAARTADYYLEPPITGYGIMEFEAIEEIVEVGYQYAGEKIDEWKEEVYSTNFRDQVNLKD